MENNDITEILKKAFEYKNTNDYKKSMDYFYKALAIDSESTEIMRELAFLYMKLGKSDRAMSFYEQIVLRTPKSCEDKFKLATILKSLNEYKRSEEILTTLFKEGYELNKTAKELFSICSSNKNYKKIIDLYNESSISLVDSDVLYYVGLAYSGIGNNELAEIFFKKSLNNDSTNITAGAKVAEYLFEKKEIEEAENLALRLLQYGENDILFNILAEIAFSKSNIDSAIKYYSYAIKINSSNSLYYFKLGIAYSLKGFFNEAEASYSKAIDFDQRNETYNFALAYLYYMNSNEDLAEKLTDLILSFNENNIDALALKSILIIKRNKTADAEKYIEKIEQIKNRSDFSYYVQSVYYSELELWEKAIYYIKKAIKENENSLEYKYHLAKIYFLNKEYENSNKICEEIIEKNPKYIQAHILNAKLFEKQKKLESAISSINKALDLDKNIFDTYYLLAKIYYEKENFVNALQNYKIAALLNPNKEEIFARIAKCCYKLENYQDAYYYFKEAAEFNISNAEYRYYMAKCSIYNNDMEKALSNFSIMKRLEPYNIFFIKEYADFLYNNNKKKAAISLIKSLLKSVSNSNKKDLEKTLNSYK